MHRKPECIYPAAQAPCRVLAIWIGFAAREKAKAFKDLEGWSGLILSFMECLSSLPEIEPFGCQVSATTFTMSLNSMWRMNGELAACRSAVLEYSSSAAACATL